MQQYNVIGLIIKTKMNKTVLLQDFPKDISDYSLKRFINKTLKLDPIKQKHRLTNTLPNYLDQVTIGLLLSDGSIERPLKTGGARLSVIFGIDNLPYLTHLFNLYEPLTDSG